MIDVADRCNRDLDQRLQWSLTGADCSVHDQCRVELKEHFTTFPSNAGHTGDNLIDHEKRLLKRKTILLADGAVKIQRACVIKLLLR